MKGHFAFLALLTLLVVSCKKEAVSVEPGPVNPQQIVKEFDSCNCSPIPGKGADSQYIRAEINGVPICFDLVPAVGDTFPNMLKYGVIMRDTGNQYYDNLYMIRNAANSHWQLALFFENTYALTKSYPYYLPRANSEVCEVGELQLNDLDHYVGCAWCPENKYNYFGHFSGYSVSMIVNSFENNVFTGTFQGVVSTGSGKTATITNGSFRIKLVVFQSDIDLR